MSKEKKNKTNEDLTLHVKVGDVLLITTAAALTFKGVEKATQFIGNKISESNFRL